MKSLFAFSVSIVLSSSLSATESFDASVQTFYQDPSYTHFLDAHQALSRMVAQATDRETGAHLYSAASVFFGQAVTAHPDYLQELAFDIEHLMGLEKALLIEGISLYANGQEEKPSFLEASFLVSNPSIPSLDQVCSFAIDPISGSDFYLLSYFATGERRFLEPIDALDLYVDLVEEPLIPLVFVSDEAEEEQEFHILPIESEVMTEDSSLQEL